MRHHIGGGARLDFFSLSFFFSSAMTAESVARPLPAPPQPPFRRTSAYTHTLAEGGLRAVPPSNVPAKQEDTDREVSAKHVFLSTVGEKEGLTACDSTPPRSHPRGRKQKKQGLHLKSCLPSFFPFHFILLFFRPSPLFSPSLSQLTPPFGSRVLRRRSSTPASRCQSPSRPPRHSAFAKVSLCLSLVHNLPWPPPSRLPAQCPPPRGRCFMMATIEPRLIHLLNNSQTPDLPPIQLLPTFATASPSESLSLAPLEPDPSQRGDKSAPSAPSVSSAPRALPLHALAVDDPPASNPVPRTDNAFANDTPGRLTEPVRPLRLLLENTDANTSTLSLRMLVDETPDNGSEDPSTKKRHRALTTKDDFVQLPQPLKKQKSTQNVVPPIIAGLHEPPPNAAVFPPITGPFNDSEAAPSLGIPKEFGSTAVEGATDRTVAPSASEGDRASGPAKGKRRPAKPRRKWTDEETNHLLLGVSRHGVGKWTSILEDPDFTFNERTAGDLKDRFRTCCPDELRGTFTNSGGKRSSSGKDGTASGKIESISTSEDGGSSHNSLPLPKPKHGILLESILIDPEDAIPRANVLENDRTTQLQPQQDSDSAHACSAKQPRKSRAHRKRMEDLEELGIRGPFKKSHRRE